VHLRTFGCLCHPNISSTAGHKLSPRTTKCVLGLPREHKGYRSFDLSTRKVILSRHVVFDENSFPYHSGASPATSDLAPATAASDPAPTTHIPLGSCPQSLDRSPAPPTPAPPTPISPPRSLTPPLPACPHAERSLTAPPSAEASGSTCPPTPRGPAGSTSPAAPDYSPCPARSPSPSAPDYSPCPARSPSSAGPGHSLCPRTRLHAHAHPIPPRQHATLSRPTRFR
jgi:hypothetical protein